MLSVDEETGLGSVGCVARGSYVGDQNVTFLVRQDGQTGFGRYFYCSDCFSHSQTFCDRQKGALLRKAKSYTSIKSPISEEHLIYNA